MVFLEEARVVKEELMNRKNQQKSIQIEDGGTIEIGGDDD